MYDDDGLYLVEGYNTRSVSMCFSRMVFLERVNKVAVLDQPVTSTHPQTEVVLCIHPIPFRTKQMGDKTISISLLVGESQQQQDDAFSRYSNDFARMKCLLFI